jgi:hypothetical protein
VSTVEALLAPADALRARVYRLVAPWAGPLFADRERRVAWLGMAGVAFSLLLTLTVPLWSLALGPVLLGVPHLVSDWRYLVVRPGLHRRTGLAVLGAVPLLATCLGAGPAVGLLAIVPATLGARGPVWRKALVLSGWAVLTALALGFRTGVQLVLLHGHNVLAVALWWWAWRPRHSRAWGVPLLAAAGTVALLLGVAEPVLSALGAWTAPATGTSFGELVETLSPLEGHPVLALRLVLVFAFLQSVHYGVWLRLVPEEDRPRAAPRPWRATWRALVEDFGAPLLVSFLLLALAVVAAGLVDLPRARLGYLQLAAFHGYLELAVAALWLVEGRRAC